jgi:5-methylcytosine-specific restriction enzyme A
MTELSDLRPTRKELIFDLAAEAGLDVQDWIESSKSRHSPNANPKYCYEWAFIEPDKTVILNLWHSDMVETAGRIVQHGNYRADAQKYGAAGKPVWKRRALTVDRALQAALRGNLPIRVVVLDGTVRDRLDPFSAPSHVTARQLDPEPWTINWYRQDTGEHELARGIVSSEYVDQFDLEQVEKTVAKQDVSGSAFVRDPSVRRAVLKRARRHCELCGNRGFRMASGAIYLETHHVVPLSEGGSDGTRNVVALCANDHRRAHYGETRDAIRAQLLLVATNGARHQQGQPSTPG